MAERGEGRRLRPKRIRIDRLGPEATVLLAEERKLAGVDEVMATLDRELVGLDRIKGRIREIAALLLVDRVRRRYGLEAPRPNLHMSFTGSPGTGKTTVAMRMADLLHRLGYLDEGHMVAVMRDDLVGQYVGQTAPLTRAALKKAMGGVLFIDEAYHLHRPDSGKDYGPEAIEILLQVMENERDKVVVILAGYADRMEKFYLSNPGMSSRIAHHLHFDDYELDELDAIGQLMVKQAGYYLSDEAEELLKGYLVKAKEEPLFANARTVRNALERARFRHANRLLEDLHRPWGRDDFMRLDAEDLRIDESRGA